MAEKKNSGNCCMRSPKAPNNIIRSNTNSSAGLAVEENKPKISTLFFDLDNTLIPTRSGDAKACRKLAEVLENKFAFTKEESSTATQGFLKSFRRCPDNSQTSLDSWRTYLWREALPNRYKGLAEQIYPIWLQLRYRYLAVPLEYIQLLKRFREAGFLLALITNGPSNAQWEKIRKLNISQYFDCVLVSSDLPWEKPNPNIFYAACNFLGVKPPECVMIGDKLESDIKGGRLANLGLTFWVPLNPSEIDLTDVTYPPDIILTKLLDLCKYFPALNCANGPSGSTSATSSNQTSTSSISPSASSQSRRRNSNQISCSGVTSTCDNDLNCLQQHHIHRLNKQHNRQENHINKYKRGGSLPTIECLNSETENSSDSLFS